ncbi:MAG: polysaccharide biosynthesis/export family protein [Elainellaceae cyanobacterium]
MLSPHLAMTPDWARAPNLARALGLASFWAIASVCASGAVFLLPTQRVVAQPNRLQQTLLQEPDLDGVRSALSETALQAQAIDRSDPLLRLEDASRRLQQRGTVEPESQALESPDAEFTRYRLGPGDSIFVSVQRFPDLSFQATLDIQGNIIVPLVGIMPLQGLTIEEARSSIQQEMNRYIIEPSVDLTLVVQRPVQVTVLGEVVRPGLYPLGAPQLTVALLSAGGATRLANLKTVQIRRTLRDQTGAIADQVEQNVDLFTPLATGQTVPDVQLADGDIIIIPALTPAEAAEYDRALIARSNLSQPSMQVRVLSYPQSIGNLELPNGSDFLDAITILSPDQRVSNLRKIALVRFDPETGGVIQRELDARAALMGDRSENPILEDDDVLIIGRNLISRITFLLNTFTQPFRDILGFILFFDTINDSADTLFRPDSD